MTITREDIELYLMGEYDGDTAALEVAIAEDPALRGMLSEEAALETVMRDAANDSVFCVGCHDLVDRDALRCTACGVAVKPGGYVVERVLVSNSHGRMYVARDADGTRVALKELAFVQTPTRDAIAMFEREAKFLRALEHAAIPQFKASFEEGTGVHTRYYLAQELVSGESLETKLDDHFFSEAEILDVARQVLEVLVYLQSVSPMVIHRDIKPANLIAKPDGKIAVVDFGAAHVQGTTAGSTSIGTFGYMPIEQLAGLVDATTDVYALGASLIHLLSRREPWRLLQGASLEGINVSHPLRDFLAKIVATDPAHRFPDANAALAGLDGVVRGERISPIVSAKRRRFARPALLATTALCLAAAGYGAHAVTTTTAPPHPGYGEIVVMFHPVDATHLSIDGVSYGRVGNTFTATVEAGSHFVRLNPGCTQSVEVKEDSAAFVMCEVTASDLLSGTLEVEMVGKPTGQMFVDGTLVATMVHGGSWTALPSGMRQIRIVAEDGSFCEHALDVVPNKTNKVRCEFAKAPSERTTASDSLPPGRSIDVTFMRTSVHDAVRVVSEMCKLNMVVPDNIDAKITATLKKAPCDQALEVLLESHGLWYRYSKAGNVILVAPRQRLDREVEAQAWRTRSGFVDDVLPKGADLDLDFKDTPLRDILRIFADTAGVNLVLPDGIEGKVTVRLKKAPWGVTLATILESHGLWYRYRPNGRLLRVAPRQLLDREAEAQKARDQKTR